MRLDKFLVETGVGSRKEVKQLIKKGRITVQDETIKNPQLHINESTDVVCLNGEPLRYQEFYYFLLNKPQGVISATEDKKDPTVVDLLRNEDYRKDIFPVGRLDKDTEGLLLLTNDGQLAHQLLSPKKHVDKEYFAIIQGIVTEKEQAIFEKGFSLENGELVKPSKLFIEKINCDKDTSEIRLIIQEGKFHQVKRMFQAMGKKVTYLKRLRMGTLLLPPDLSLGKYRPLTSEELAALKALEK